MKLNAEQIKKALECCTKAELCNDECPYDSFAHCMRKMTRDTLSLINELTEELTKKETEYNELYELTEDLQKENERLQQTISQLGKNNDEIARVYPLAIKEAKADTVRKMQERLHEQFRESVAYTRSYIHEGIDQIAKEMLEWE